MSDSDDGSWGGGDTGSGGGSDSSSWGSTGSGGGSDSSSWGGTETGSSTPGETTGWDTGNLTGTEGQPTSFDPSAGTSGGGDVDFGSSDIEIAFCFNDEQGYTHTVYAKSRKDAESKAGRWNYCHAGACQSDDALKEQCE